MGAGPDRAIHFPSSPSMDGMLVGRSDERPSPMMVTPAAARRPTDAQVHLFRKGKTNALYFREPGRH